MSALLAVAHGTLLQAAGALAAAAEPAPSPSSIEIPPEDQTSPGLLGFLVTFAVAAAVIALGFSLVRHLRVVDRNARRLEAEEPGSAGAVASTGAAGAESPAGAAGAVPPAGTVGSVPPAGAAGAEAPAGAAGSESPTGTAGASGGPAAPDRPAVPGGPAAPDDPPPAARP